MPRRFWRQLRKDLRQSLPDKPDRLWSRRQRGAAAGLLAVVLGVIGWRLSQHTASVPARLTPDMPLAATLDDRLNPNTATEAQLTAVPGIGPARAAAIVAHREASEHRPAYRRAEDLEQVRGIGPTIRENISPYLRFE